MFSRHNTSHCPRILEALHALAPTIESEMVMAIDRQLLVREHSQELTPVVTLAPRKKGTSAFRNSVSEHGNGRGVTIIAMAA